MGISMGSSIVVEGTTKKFNYEDAIRNFIVYLNEEEFDTYNENKIIGAINIEDIEKYINYVMERIDGSPVSEVNSIMIKVVNEIRNNTINKNYYTSIFSGLFSFNGFMSYIELMLGCKTRTAIIRLTMRSRLTPLEKEELILEPELLLLRREKNKEQDAYQKEQANASSYSEVNVVTALYPTVWPKECLSKFSFTMQCTNKKAKEQIILKIETALKDAGIKADYSESENSFSIIVIQAPLDDLGLLLDLKRNMSSDKAIIFLDAESLNDEQTVTAENSLIKCKQVYLTLQDLLHNVAKVDPNQYKTMLDKLYSVNKNLKAPDEIYKLLPASAKSDCRTREEALYKFLYNEYVGRMKQEMLERVQECCIN